MRRIPAARAFHSAVQHDRSFALAWYRLSVAALWSAQLELSRDAIERAVALRERLSEHDGMLVEAFAAFLRGEAEVAERLYRTIAGNHPDDLEAWYQLGETLFHYGPRGGGSIRESRAAWERVLALEPEHMSALAHMAVIAACDDDWTEVSELVNRALAISPEGDAITWMQALQAWGSGDRAAQERVQGRLRKSSDFAAARAAWYVALPCRSFEGATALSRLLCEGTRSPDAQAVGGLWLAHLELAQGRVQAAREQLRELFTLMPFLVVSRDELEKARQSVAAWNVDAVPRCITSGAYFTVHNGLHGQLQRYMLGMLAARLEDRETAMEQAVALRGMGNRPEARDLACDQAQAVEAVVAMNEERTDSALAKLEDACIGALFELAIASPFYSRALERYLKAQLLEQVGRDREAIRWYASFAEHSIYDLIFLAPSFLRRGEIYERLGQPQRAADHYRQFLESWSDADAELRPHVERARSRLAALVGES
jgi:tetratricopeptide (TPR) repeat protein